MRFMSRKDERDEVVNAAIRAAGGLSRLGKAVGITAQGVWRWRRIPPQHVATVERVTGIPRERLRPDIFGAPRPRPRKTKHVEAAA
jgi:DNA-binding transcriptional regulator YdaS (Cro superfamily)